MRLVTPATRREFEHCTITPALKQSALLENQWLYRLSSPGIAYWFELLPIAKSDYSAIASTQLV